MMTGAISIKSLIAFTALGFLLASTVLSPLHLPRLSFIADFFASKSKPDPPEGLSLIYEGDKPTVDIVFVHGLNGHRERTWTASNGIFWPRDLLPDDLPQTRIFSWGYDARTLATTKISGDDLHGYGMSLAADLSLARIETKTVRRPIIFIAHSLGGLVVKSALIHCDSTRPGHLEDDKAIQLSTRSIYFFGTPHRGGNGVNLGLLLVRIGAVAFNKNENLLQHLASSSERLQLLTKQFLPLVDDFEINFFYETKDTDLPGGTSMRIVPKDSAVIPIKNAREVPIADGHRNLVRYSSRQSAAYSKVSRRLVQSAEDATAFVERVWENFDRAQASRRKASDVYNMTASLLQHRNPLFTGREEPLQILDHNLLNRLDQQSVVVVTGMGGIGKSQLASEFIYLHRPEFTSVFWIEASSEDLINQGFNRIAMSLFDQNKTREIEGLDRAFERFESAEDADRANRAIELVKQWLSYPSNTHWLLVFDGYDQIETIDILQFLPASNQGHVIVTSRRPEARRLGYHLPLDLFSLEDGVGLLLRSSRQLHPNEELPDETRRVAAKVIHELGYLPLAIDQAGAYISAQQIEMDTYLSRLHSNFKKTSSRTPEVNWPYGKSLFTTWEMHLEAIQIQNPAAIRVLTLCAFLGTEAVTLDMFRPITDYEPSLFPAGSNVTSSLHELTEAAWSKFENKEVPGINEAISYFDKELQDNKGNLHDTLELLFTYSFATRRGKQGISVHPLVLMWAKERLSEAEKIQAARDAVVLVTDHHSRAFKMDLWIKREFSQYIHPLNVRCYQLVDEYLTEDPIYFDFPLFLAIERLAIDSSYSRDLINPLGLTAVIKTSWVGSRISDLSSVLLHYHPYLTLETPKYVIEDLANNSVTHAELLVIFNSLQYRNGSLDLEHFIAMRLLLNNDREAPVDLDRLTGRYSQVHERMRDLLNLLQLEERLEFLPKVDYAQKLADIVDAFHLHVLDVKDHVHGWKYGLTQKKLTTPDNFIGRSFHPVVLKWMKSRPDKFETLLLSFTEESSFVKDFRIDFIIQRHEIFLLRLWKAVLQLAETQDPSLEFPPVKAWLRSVLRTLEFIRNIYLPHDHSSLVASKKRMLEANIDLTGPERMIKDLSWDLACMVYATSDPSPYYLDLKWELSRQLLNLKISEKRRLGEAVCVDLELFLVFKESIFQISRITHVGGITNRDPTSLLAYSTFSEVFFTLNTTKVCKGTSEPPGLLTMYSNKLMSYVQDAVR